jgi:hypothetical protein
MNLLNSTSLVITRADKSINNSKYIQLLRSLSVALTKSATKREKRY